VSPERHAEGSDAHPEQARRVAAVSAMRIGTAGAAGVSWRTVMAVAFFGRE
jgi:hypothetical protein